MPPPVNALVGPWRALERFADGRWAAPLLVVAALAVYALVSVVLPLAPGRDLGRYLVVYAQLFDAHVVYPTRLPRERRERRSSPEHCSMPGRSWPRSAPRLLYALSILAWCAVARRFGAAAAIATAAALLLYPGYVDALPPALERRRRSRLRSRSSPGSSPVRSSDRARSVRCPSAPRSPRSSSCDRSPRCCSFSLSSPCSRQRRWRARMRGSAAFALAAVVPLLALGGAQRRPRRGLHAGARWRGDASALPCLRRRPHRRAGERPRHAGARARRRARTSCHTSRTAPTRSTSSSSSPRAARACTRT